MIRATVKSTDLAAAMKHSVAPRSSTLPILQCALVEASDGALRITTSDMETHCTVTLPARVEGEGAVALDAAKLAASALVGDDVQIVQTMDGVTARGAGRNRVKLPHLPAAEYPVPDEESWTATDVPAATLRQALECVLYAAPSNDVRYYLNGVCMGGGFVAATDVRVLARAPVEYDGPTLIIPTKRVQTIARMLASEGTTLRVACSRDGAPRLAQVCMREGERRVELSVLLVSGKFPDAAPLFKRIDNDAAWTIDVDRAALRRAVDGVRPFATGKAFPFASLVVSAAGVYLRADAETEIAVSDVPQAHDFSVGLRLDSFGRMVDSGDTPTVTLSRLIGGASNKGGSLDMMAITSADGSAHLLAGSAL